MDLKITRTRVIIPQRRPDQLSRPRVLKRLFDQSGHKLLIVVAPPGYGKTSLLIDFAKKSPDPVCWYAIDSLDQNPSRFFAHIVACISHIFDYFGEESRLALQELMANNGTLLDLVPTIVNELYDRVEGHFTLVLDDFHLVQENNEIQEFLNAFIQQVEGTCRIIMASRRLIRLPDLPLMVARSLVGGVSMEDLAFQTDEIQALLAQNFDQAIDDDMALELSDQTEGWVTGLLLSTQLTQQNPIVRGAVQRATGIDLYDYLAQQVFLQQPPEIQTFLLRTSLLDEFNAERCQQILVPLCYPADTDWRQLIDVVVANNLFILPVGDGGSWFRYHTLFQDFLTRRVDSERPDETNQILDAVADCYIQERAWEKAHRIRQRQGNIELIAEMIESAIPVLIQECQLPLCRQWLDELPDHVFRSHPMLLAVKGYDYASIELTHSINLLERATEQLALAPSSLNYATALTWSANVGRRMSDLDSAMKDADAALRTLDLISAENTNGRTRPQSVGTGNQENSELASGVFEPELAIRAEALCSKGIIFCLTGKTSDGIYHLEKAVEIYDALGDCARGALVLTDLATANMHIGRYKEARTQFHKALDRTGNYSRQRSRIQILNNLGGLYHLEGEYIKAYSLLRQSVETAREVNHTYLQALSLTSLGELLMDVMDTESAQSCYQEALALISERDLPQLTLHIEAARAQLACMAEEWAVAFDCLDRVGRTILSNQKRPEWHTYKTAMGLFYLARQNNRQAIKMFCEALDGWIKTEQRIEEAQTRLLLAGAYYRAEETEETLVQLEQTYQIAIDLHVWQPLTIKGRMVTDMLNEIANQDEHVVPNTTQIFAADLLSRIQHFNENLEGVRHQLSNTRLENGKQPLAAGSMHEIFIRTLGRIDVSYKGAQIQNWQGKSHISRDLFLCLVAHKDGLTKEELGALFWPEAAPAELKARFKNAVYRVRKVFSPDVLLFDGDIYRFNRELDFHCDAHAFEDAIATARDSQTSLHEKKAYQNALALYQGEYLVEIDAIWAWLERERLGQLYIDASIRLAEIHLDYGENSEALQLCQALLADDTCLEEAHRMIMRIHAANGNRGALIRQYELCEQSMQDEFRTPPSEQTRFLFISLTS